MNGLRKVREESNQTNSEQLLESDLVTFVLAKGIPFLITEIKKVYPETYMEGSCSGQVKAGKSALSKIKSQVDKKERAPMKITIKDLLNAPIMIQDQPVVKAQPQS